MARKKRGAAVVLDSFLDIMTCMLGIIIFIILLTGVDASQIKVLIRTPLQRMTDKTPVYIECRHDELFLVPVLDLRDLAKTELSEVARSAKGNTATMLKLLAEASAETDAYRVDLTYALLGQFAIVPREGTEGYQLRDMSKEMSTDWFGRILTGLDPEKEMLTFLVRDDSYDVFKRARALAWARKVDVSYELMDVRAPIKFGLGGERSLAQ